jgi:hypothetical protein
MKNNIFQDSLKKTRLLGKLSAILSVLLASVLPLILLSLLLIQMGIIQYPLWHEAEPWTVSVLKGTNITSQGRWNEADGDSQGDPVNILLGDRSLQGFVLFMQ